MGEDDMEAIVGEKDSMRVERQRLEDKLKLLSDGSETCKKFSGFRALGTDLYLKR